MLSVDAALELLLREVELLPSEEADLFCAAGRILAESVRAPHDSPPFDTTAMDGYAVKSSDVAGAGVMTGADAAVEATVFSVRLPVQGEVVAGDRARPELLPGHALRINTGAPMPLGADAVVRIEDTRPVKVGVNKSEEGVGSDTSDPSDLSAKSNPSESWVEILSAPAAGHSVRRAGEDYHAGEVLLRPGRRLDPPALGLLASLGRARVAVARRPRVALLTTGDELVEPGKSLGFGQIHDSSRYALRALLPLFGAEVHDLGIARDEPEATRAALAAGLTFDVLLTTGGVSMGSRDLIRPTLLELGVREVFWRVNQRPGKPLFIGRGPGGAAQSTSSIPSMQSMPSIPSMPCPAGGTLCFGLPGNPVSVFVTALVYVRAALLGMQGASDCELPWRKAIAAREFKGQPGLTVFSRADTAPSGEAGLANRTDRTDRSDPSDPPTPPSPSPAPAPAFTPRVLPSPGQGSHQFSALAGSAGIVRLGESCAGVAAGEPIDFLDFRLLF